MSTSVDLSIDMQTRRAEFPILSREVYGKPLVYLDNAATAQKPRCVIDALVDFYTRINANVHRGVHRLSQDATAAFEGARETIQRFVGAPSPEEIVWTRGTTEAINLVAQSFGRTRVGRGDRVLISALEHHSNIVPWQMLCEAQGAHLDVIPMNDTGELLQDAYERLLTPTTRLVAVSHVSNALGTVNPVKEMIEKAHARGIPVLVDGAQAVPHVAVDVKDLGCDFYAFSAHKMFGPTGVGALFGRRELLEAMPPYQGGGDMIKSVTFEKTIYNDVPHKFEAGTPSIADAVGFGVAAQYLQDIGLDRIAAFEHELLEYATSSLSELPGIRLIGTSPRKASVLSFTVEGVHPHDVGTILDREGVAVRAGHHCAQPVMDFFGVPATVRASLAFYNNRQDVDALVAALSKVQEMFA
jgi:cysteine desulfurase/selenocysteine lyase